MAGGGSKSDQGSIALGCLVVLVLIAGAYSFLTGKSGDSQPSRTAAPAQARLTGSFERWEPIDDSHGYAYFSIRNSGTSSATATCTVIVRDDFGDVGFDYMSGEVVAAGQSLNGRMALSVSGQGAYRITSGELKDC